MRPIRDIPTNVIFGFLGVGKTTAILDWIGQKPAREVWSVLVNEFGEIGIDGEIYERNGVAVKEIPGGCMCCAQGLPLQVAVNRLLRETRPDRLLIESSGIGHPAGVLKTLQGDGFRGVLALKAVIGLVDPEQLCNPALSNNELFMQQLALADALVANKTDLASATGLQAFSSLGERFRVPKSLLASTTHGRMRLDWLDAAHTDRSADDAGMPRSQMDGSRWQTYSWRFSADTTFGLEAFEQWTRGLDVLRLKAVVNTAAGSYLFNYAAGALSVEALASAQETRVQIIDDQAANETAKAARARTLERGLYACIAAPAA